MSRIRVAHLVQCGPTTGGTVSHVALQVAYQVAMGLDVMVVAASDGVLTDRSRRSGAAVIVDESLGLQWAGDPDSAADALARTLGDWAPDLIHSHLMHAGFAGRAVSHRLGVPQIYTQHMFTPVDPFIRTASLSGGLPHLIAVAEPIREGLSDFLGVAQPVHLVPNGVDVPPDIGFRLRSGAGPDVLYCGRLSQEKGDDTALLAFALVARCRPDATLHVVGTGPDETLLRRMVAELQLESRVEFYGSVSGALSRAAGADLALVPSRGEAASLVAMEAMASGVPVIASAVGGLPWVLGEGSAGSLVPPDDPVALAAEIERLLGDSAVRDRYSRTAKARHASLFRAETMVERTVEIYRAVLSGRVCTHEPE